MQTTSGGAALREDWMWGWGGLGRARRGQNEAAPIVRSSALLSAVLTLDHVAQFPSEHSENRLSGTEGEAGQPGNRTTRSMNTTWNK